MEDFCLFVEVEFFTGIYIYSTGKQFATSMKILLLTQMNWAGTA